jgi:hypothetical protein
MMIEKRFMEKTAVSKGAGYYHAKTGKFTWKRIIDRKHYSPLGE